jgi:hypothetical protein
LEVNVVDLPLDEEMRLNVQMNNDTMMGSWNFDKLAEIVNSGVTPEELGFTPFDVSAMLPELAAKGYGLTAASPEAEAMKAGLKEIAGVVEAAEDADAATEEATEAADSQMLSDIRAAKKQARGEWKDANKTDFYLLVVCDSVAEREELCALLGVEETSTYITAENLKAAFHEAAES